MDNETKQLLEELKLAIDGGKKPFFQNILQAVVVALIVAIPTIIMIGNKFENRVLEIELNQQQITKDMDFKQQQLAKDLIRREFKIDYNFQLIESNHPELNFIKVTENNE